MALGAPKQRALLAALLLAEGEVVPRERLVDAIWGEAPPESAIGSLQVYVHGLRRVLGEERIETRGTAYRVVLEPDELDLTRFERHVERGRRALDAGDPAGAAGELRAALALWRGPALAGLTTEVAARAAELEDRRVYAAELRNDAELALGRHGELLEELEGLVAEHPYRERFREQRIVALYRAGRQKEALEAYRAAREVLLDELGIEPGAGLRQLEQAILRHDPELAAPQRRPAQRPLPVAPTPLVGRRLETAAVSALLRREDVRLVTLTGPGGTGKTRLALAAAEELAPDFLGGALFVDLSSVSDPALVPEALAHALEITVAEDDVSAAVVEAVRKLPLLLVLDNLEQLLPELPVLPHLLSSAPRLRVLATSRAPLRLSGEHEYPVPPLPAPPEGAAFERAVRNDAVRLFAERVRAVDPGFVLDDRNVDAVAAICRRLDGLPLALELAAARARVLPPAELERRLGSLDLLVGGAHDLPHRQRTLRATLEWSHRLLGAAEQAALARLAVFAGGFSVESAEAVIRGGDPLAALTTLVEHSLLRRVDGAAAPRFLQLETIREFALEQLRAEGAEEELRHAHAEHFRELAEQLSEELLAGTSERALARLDEEHENLLAALAWTAESGAVETEVRVAAALRPYWSLRGELAEARRVFEAAIAHSADDPALHATALVHGAVFAYRRGDTKTALTEWERALGLFRELGDEGEAARCIGELGAVAMAEGDLDRAEQLWREAAGTFAAQGNRLREALVLANLAAVAAERGLYEQAVAEGERALALQREIGDRDGVCVSVHNLSRYTLVLGDTGASRRLMVEALESSTQLGYRELLAAGLGTAAELALLADDPERATRLLAASDALVEAGGFARAAEEQEACEQVRAAAIDLLGDVRFTELSTQGRALSPEQAVAEAVEAMPTPSG